MQPDTNHLWSAKEEAGRLQVHAGESGFWTESKTLEKHDDVVDSSSPESFINQRMVIWKGLTQE